jgi:tetratricopeptide (TPR) repeat protein
VLFTPEQPGATLAFEISGANDASIELKLEGRGEPHFAAVLRGFTSRFAVTDGAPRAPQHDYLAAPARYRGAEIPWGFSVLQDSREPWRNKVSELAHGALTRCRLDAWIPREGGGREEDPAYWIAEIPIPAGARVMQGSWSGSHAESFELDAGVLRVHLGELWSSVSIEYTLIGAAPGSYRALPAVFRSAYEPDRTVIAPPTTLKVLARGETSSDAYRPTPDELYHLGLAKFAAGEKEAARELLQALIDGFEPKLREQPLAASANALLFANIERRAPRDIVRYFEILKEKDPDVYVPFEKVLAVGAAYREIEEHERALTIFRATIEETFGKELQVVGALEEQRELGDALDTLAKLCREYPDASRVLDANLSLSDKLLKLAPTAHKEPSLVKSGRDRMDLLLGGILDLQRFLALHATDPRAPDAALNLVTAHLALDDYATVSKLGGEFAAAYTEPRFADAFAYSRAVAEWYLGRDDAARGMLDRIAKAEYTNKDGTKSPSPNRDLALYILGQIHHARQEFADAAAYYERVQEIFADARDTLVSLREKRISMPEVTEVRPGSKVEFELSHRNIGEAELLVYPVDLMTLYLREKNLAKIAKVNLSGIAPTVRRTVALESKEGLRPAKTKVAIELPDAGAYLVICRGGDLHASGLVLVSNIALDVKENAESGQLRVQATEHGSNRFLRNVDVRVIGALNADFVSGRTDPRGLFVAEGLSGNATVIARSGERQYAFYRGTAPLAVAQNAERPRGQTAGKTDYLSNLGVMNDAAQSERGRNLDAEIRADRKGVQIRSVK